MDIAKQVTAYVHHDGDHEYCLQIELGNDHAITLTCRNGVPARVTLWRSSGEVAWGTIQATSVQIREFVADAFEPR